MAKPNWEFFNRLFLLDSQLIAPCAYMPEKVMLDHVPSYVFHKSVIIQPQGYIKYVYYVQMCKFLYSSHTYAIN